MLKVHTRSSVTDDKVKSLEGIFLHLAVQVNQASPSLTLVSVACIREPLPNMSISPSLLVTLTQPHQQLTTYVGLWMMINETRHSNPCQKQETH
jgi:hypothetical protein